MGRQSWSGRCTVEDSKVLDIFWFKKNDYLCGFRSGTITWKRGDNVTGSIGIQVDVHGEQDQTGSVGFFYTFTNNANEEATQLDYRVMLVTTSCNYGKYRWWFVCPLLGCQKRVAKLYLPPGAKYFGCRTCYNLTYESCRESHGWGYRFAKSHGMTLGQLGKLIRGET